MHVCVREAGLGCAPAPRRYSRKRIAIHVDGEPVFLEGLVGDAVGSSASGARLRVHVDLSRWHLPLDHLRCTARAQARPDAA